MRYSVFKFDHYSGLMNCVTVCRLCGTTVNEIMVTWARSRGRVHPNACENVHLSKGFAHGSTNCRKAPLEACLVEMMGFTADPYHSCDGAHDDGRWAAGVRYLKTGTIPKPRPA